MAVEEFADFINKKAKGYFSDPSEVVRLFQKSARSSYRLPKNGK